MAAFWHRFSSSWRRLGASPITDAGGAALYPSAATWPGAATYPGS